VRDLDDLYPYKHSIVSELYIKTADENYVAARWCFANGLDIDFFWLAAHCVEKYLKAALLLNELPAKNQGHDIERLYAEVRPLAPELLPATLTVPEHLPMDIFSLGDEPVEQFVKRLYFYGQPDNRYSFIGYTRTGSEIIKLDQLVFAVRRLCQPLEAHFLGERLKDRSDFPRETRRQRMVRDDPASRNLYSHLEDIISGKRGKVLRRALLNWNLPFAPAKYRHGRMAYGSMMTNPDELWAWARDNLYFPREFIKVYEKARTDRKTAAKAKRAGKS
jgi:HEPN domain